MTDFVEQRILEAVRKLLTGRVNDILNETQFAIPIIEFGGNGGGYAVAPLISLSTCERTEKERIIRLDSYSLSISFTLPESPDSELHCYAYSGAIGRAFYDDPTLGGFVDKAVITSKKYVSPKKPNCGEGWGLVLIVRITVEGIKYAG